MASIAGTVLLAKEEDDNMVSAWVDYLYAHRLVDGTYSVTAEKLMLDQEEELITIDSVEGITTPRQFIDAVNRCSMTIEIEVYWSDALKALSELNKDFSAQVQSLVE